MAIVTAIFAVMAYFYVPSRYSGEPEGDGAAIVINATSSSDLQFGEGVNGDGGNSHSGNNMQMEPIISEQQIISRFTVVPVKEPISIAYWNILHILLLIRKVPYAPVIYCTKN